ncbi:hypothetical protein B0H13DRAFT_2372426 [Mycena leptocephala]|nr:hypothetical protein B0H13DRAFT_2372426 [Mycena leptocephala]
MAASQRDRTIATGALDFGLLHTRVLFIPILSMISPYPFHSSWTRTHLTIIPARRDSARTDHGGGRTALGVAPLAYAPRLRDAIIIGGSRLQHIEENLINFEKGPFVLAALDAA